MNNKKYKCNKDFIIIVPVGDNSLHKNWCNSDIYDLFVIYYDKNKEIEKKYKNNADFFHKDNGPKWQIIKRALKLIELEKYDYVWFPDDNLKISKKNIEQLFIISKKNIFMVSQPAFNVKGITDKKIIDINYKWTKENIFPKKEIYIKKSKKRIKSNQIVEQINNFLTKKNFKTKNSKDIELIEQMQKTLYKWKLFHYDHLYIGWDKWYLNNTNEINTKINDWVEFKFLLQKYPKKEKVIRKSNYINTICPLFNVNYFLKPTISNILNYSFVQSGQGLGMYWSNKLQSGFDSDVQIYTIDFLSVEITQGFGDYKDKSGKFRSSSIEPEEEEKLIYQLLKSQNDYTKFNPKSLQEFSLLKPKIAFLFLTKEDLNYPKVWKEYFKGNENLINIYCHPKYPNKIKSFLKNYIIPETTETSWGNISIVKAMTLLLFEAVQNGNNQYFVFRSATCVPLTNFNKFYKYVTKIKTKSLVTLGNSSGQHLKRYAYVKKNYEEGLNKDNFYKGETWTILNRNHVLTILREINSFIHAFKDVYVPEEHVNIIITLLNYGRTGLLDSNSTMVLWDRAWSPHPHLFGPNLKTDEKKYILDSIKKNNSFFGRKFDYQKTNNVEKFIMDLIK